MGELDVDLHGEIAKRRVLDGAIIALAPPDVSAEQRRDFRGGVLDGEIVELDLDADPPRPALRGLLAGRRRPTRRGGGRRF
jgi:hypothetical protein